MPPRVKGPPKAANNKQQSGNVAKPKKTTVKPNPKKGPPKAANNKQQSGNVAKPKKTTVKPNPKKGPSNAVTREKQSNEVADPIEMVADPTPEKGKMQGVIPNPNETFAIVVGNSAQEASKDAIHVSPGIVQSFKSWFGVAWSPTHEQMLQAAEKNLKACAQERTKCFILKDQAQTLKNSLDSEETKNTSNRNMKIAQRNDLDRPISDAQMTLDRIDATIPFPLEMARKLEVNVRDTLKKEHDEKRALSRQKLQELQDHRKELSESIEQLVRDITNTQGKLHKANHDLEEAEQNFNHAAVNGVKAENTVHALLNKKTKEVMRQKRVSLGLETGTSQDASSSKTPLLELENGGN
jgi:hypothetical protein